MNKTKNVLYLYLDGLHYEFFRNTETARVLAPNIMALADKGFIHPVVPNGPHTQMAMAPMFTQSYPLDYGGYNAGIANRPKSFVELLREYGYRTYLVASFYITGPMWNIERGFSDVRCLYDWRQVLKFRQHFHSLQYEIEMMEGNGISKKSLKEFVKRKWDPVLEYACRAEGWTNDWRLSRHLRKPYKWNIRRVEAERELLRKKPMVVINKIKTIPVEHYIQFLGQEGGERTRFFRNLVERVKKCITWTFNKVVPGIGTMPLFSEKAVASANSVVRTALQVIKSEDGRPWFAMLHFTDVHECKSIFSRPLNLFAYSCFLPKLIRIGKQWKVKRSIFYDLAIMYTDKKIGRMLQKLHRRGQLDDTIIILTSDHGGGRDSARGEELYMRFGLKTFYEQCMVPFILSPIGQKPNKQGFHDTMSVSATLLDVLGISQYESFKGLNVFDPGKEACITESAERGNCDPSRRDLYFTVTSKHYKMMVELVGDRIEPLMLFDRSNDPRELHNIIDDPANHSIIDKMLSHIYRERFELFDMRGVTVPSENIDQPLIKGS